MSAATHTERHVHVPTTWIVWLIAVLAVIVITSVAVTGWERSRAASAPTPVQIHLTPAPEPGPMADLGRIGKPVSPWWRTRRAAGDVRPSAQSPDSGEALSHPHL